MLGFPRWLSSKEPACECKRRGFDPWVRKIPWRRKWQLTPVFLPGKSHGQRSLAGYSPRGCKRVGHDSVTKQQQEEIPRFVNPSVIHLHFYFNWLTIISTTKPIPYSGDVVSANWNRVDVFPWWFRISMIFFFQSWISARAVTFVFKACQLWPEIRCPLKTHLDKWIRCSSERQINVTHVTINKSLGLLISL